MNKLAELLERDAERLGKLEVQDNGKLLAEMGGQTAISANGIVILGVLRINEGTVIPTDKPNMFNFTRLEPYGVVGMITPELALAIGGTSWHRHWLQAIQR